MKTIFTLACVCGALLVGGCADQSLLTDEEYNAMKGPAPHSSDPAGHLPQPAGERGNTLGARY